MNVEDITYFGEMMKITSIQRDISLKQGPIPEQKDTLSLTENNSAGVCKNYNRGYNAVNSGNLTEKSEVAAITFKGKVDTKRINNLFGYVKKGIQKTLEKNTMLPKVDGAAERTGSRLGNFLASLEDHNIMGSALMALIFAGIARPVTIMSMPLKEGKTKEDNIYASGHSVASGIMGFLASLVITAPLDEGIKMVKKAPRVFGVDTPQKLLDYKSELKKLGESAADAAKKIELKNSIDMLKKQRNVLDMVVKNIPDWFIAIPRSMITVALIPPILKYVFGIEKKPKAPAAENTLKIASGDINFIDKKTFQDFTGGLK